MQSSYIAGIGSADDAPATNREEGLLDFIWRSVGCTYMSDLHVQPWRSMAVSLAARMEPERFTLWEWNDAAGYLLGAHRKHTDAQSAQALFRAAAGFGDGLAHR